VLKDMIILTDLKEDYHIGALIGKGNFAKVHQCKRKADDKTLALKSIEKQMIRKSRRNSVNIIFNKLYRGNKALSFLRLIF
jgi:serine/threonine protein kinase